MNGYGSRCPAGADKRHDSAGWTQACGISVPELAAPIVSSAVLGLPGTDSLHGPPGRRSATTTPMAAERGVRPPVDEGCAGAGAVRRTNGSHSMEYLPAARGMERELVPAGVRGMQEIDQLTATSNPY